MKTLEIGDKAFHGRGWQAVQAGGAGCGGEYRQAGLDVALDMSVAEPGAAPGPGLGVLLADDDPLVRAGLRLTLSSAADVRSGWSPRARPCCRRPAWRPGEGS